MEYKDYYKILGVSKQASDTEIKRAYRKLAQKFHPDRNPNNKAAEEKFKEINEANEVLGNPENRAKYDQLGVNYHRFRQMGGNPAGFDFSQWFSGGGSHQQMNIDLGDLLGGQGGFSDFFNAIFGGRQKMNSQRPGEFFQQRAANLNIEQPVTISLQDAYHGTTHTVSLHGEPFTAKIPPGARDGTKIRLRGKGYQQNGQVGDLYLVTQVDPHPLFTRDGDHLQVTAVTPVTTAVLGGHVTVSTLTGNVSLKIPAGTQGGQTFRLRGKGMPHLREHGRFGDLLVTIHIAIPTELTETERAHYEALARLSRPETI